MTMPVVGAVVHRARSSRRSSTPGRETQHAESSALPVGSAASRGQLIRSCLIAWALERAAAIRFCHCARGTHDHAVSLEHQSSPIAQRIVRVAAQRYGLVEGTSDDIYLVPCGR